MLFASAPLAAQAPDADVTQRIAALLKKHSKADFSIHFRDLDTARTVYAFNPDTPLIPASNMKLVTTAAALDQLGPDFAYETIFALQDQDLLIFAAGDPLTGDPVLAQNQSNGIFNLFDQIVAQLQRRHITELTGHLLIDDTLFDDQRFHPSWPPEQANRWYAAQIAALNFNNNCLDILFAPAPLPGQPALFSLTPDTQYVTITNQCTTVSQGTNALGALRPLNSNNITLTGSCRSPITEPVNVSIDRPSAFFGYVLAEYLFKRGIPIRGKLIIKRLRDDQGQLPPNLDILLTHRTPLKDVLCRANQRSLNMAAECLFKTLGAYHPGPPFSPDQTGSWTSGRLAVEHFLRKLDLDPDQFIIDDGSGLSKNNRLSAAVLTAVLAYMHHHPAADLFRDSLASPTAGTLAKRNRFPAAAFQDRIFAKTGHILGANTLSGYAQAPNGHWLAFSVLANSAPNATLDQIVKEFLK